MTPLFPLAHGDWAQEWRDRHELRKRPDNVHKWNSRAKDYGTSPHQSHYADDFLACMNAPRDMSGMTVLDVGCGPGTLAIPLAQRGATVYALDFAQAMLDKTREKAKACGPEVSARVVCVLGAWEDDWQALGIPQVDYIVASRSTMVPDLYEALMKLDACATKRVCMTLVASKSPKHDPILYKAVGRTDEFGVDYLYCFNILYQMGIPVELRFIKSLREDRYPTKAQAFEAARELLGEMTLDEQAALKRFYDAHLIRRETPTGDAYWVKDYPHQVRWAFMSWNPGERL